MRYCEVDPFTEAQEIATAALELSKHSKRLEQYINSKDGIPTIANAYYGAHIVEIRSVAQKLSNAALVLSDALGNPSKLEAGCKDVGETFQARQAMLDKRLKSFGFVPTSKRRN